MPSLTSASIADSARGGAGLRPRPAAIASWLFVIAALVFAMVVVGGITRLTESGLSITQWKPISGALPPLTHADWLTEFARYRATPQYQKVSGPAGMTLGDFQIIYGWEWVHRLIGRVLGLAFALPLLWIAARRAIPKRYGLRLLPCSRSAGSRARWAGTWSSRAS